MFTGFLMIKIIAIEQKSYNLLSGSVLIVATRIKNLI